MDLLVINCFINMMRLDVIPWISDHCITYAEMNTNSMTNNQKPRKIQLYRNAKRDSIKILLYINIKK